MENKSWNNTTASDVVSDILKMRENIKVQKFFAMNKATKEKVTHGSPVYDDILVENNSIPDDIIVSFRPSPHGTMVPDFINTFRLSEGKLPEIKQYEGNRKQRREAKKEQKRRMKRK